MNKAEIVQLNPKAIISAYRSFGYTLSTALADIVDNSIVAKATIIDIKYEWNGQSSWIAICDNGQGMNKEELIRAMTPGGKDSADERAQGDLGRFGMGLKTASFSQAKRLTCISKQQGSQTLTRCWDIDFVHTQNAWQLLNDVSHSRFFDSINNQSSGTLVVWEKLDRIVGIAKRDNQKGKSAFYQQMQDVKKHLGLTFHKFIEGKKLKILFQNDEIIPYNPFLLHLNPKPEMGSCEKFDNVEITYFILPHMSEISQLDYKNTGGELGWFQQQGFYIYREDRLLVAGDWLDLEKKRHSTKLARIVVNFSNASDFNWHLDIKKSTARPPIAIKKELHRIAKTAIMKSEKVYNWRSSSINKAKQNTHFEPLWKDEITRKGNINYKINRKHPMISALLAQQKSLTSSALKLLEENVPIALTLNDQEESFATHEFDKKERTPSKQLINMAIELYKNYLSQGIAKPLSQQKIMQATPFNLFPSIKKYLK